MHKINGVYSAALTPINENLSINKKLYDKKPDCISKWFGININYEVHNLIPIPIGLSNYYSPKNLFYKDSKKSDLDSVQKVNEMYVNFNVSGKEKRSIEYFLLDKNSATFSALS